MKLQDLFEYALTWKPVNGYPSYEVSNTGKVRNKATKKLLTPEVHYGKDKNEPYIRYQLKDNGKTKHIRVNRAVAFAFHGQPSQPGMEVDHKDGNRKNNKETNLEWVTPEENRRRKLERMKAKEQSQPTPRRSIRDVVRRVDEVMMIDTSKSDDYNKQSIEDDKYYLHLQLLTKNLVIGPFDGYEKASQYSNTSTTNNAISKSVVTGTEARKLV